jgi:hypothetical protein
MVSEKKRINRFCRVMGEENNGWGRKAKEII